MIVKLLYTPPFDFHLPAEYSSFQLNALYQFESLDVLFGIENWNEKAQARSPGGVTPTADTYFNGERSVEYDGDSIFLQLDWSYGQWLFSGGLRRANHSFSGDSSVPRLSAVYNGDGYHIKGYYGQAFREPDIDIINSSDFTQNNIRSEETTQTEMEFGMQLNDNWYAAVAVFAVEVAEAIIYQSNTNDFFYLNSAKPVETTGIETQWTGVWQEHFLELTYSFYKNNTHDFYPIEVPQDKDVRLGAPQHKITANYNYQFSDKWQFRSSLAWYDSFYAKAYTAGALDENDNELTIDKFSSKMLVNTLISYRFDEIELTFGIYDILDDGRIYPQPFASESTPYEGAGRQFTLGIIKSWQ